MIFLTIRYLSGSSVITGLTLSATGLYFFFGFFFGFAVYADTVGRSDSVDGTASASVDLTELVSDG
jgi:hypothetical protein